MLKVIHTQSLPMSLTADMTSEFSPGMIAQLRVQGQEIVCGLSDSSAPIGIIDDARVSSFSKPQVDEIVQIKLTPSQIITDSNGKLVNNVEVSGILENPHIIQSSFISDISVFLNYVNGIVTIGTGSECNWDYNGDGINDGYKIVTNYVYRVSNMPGSDTVSHSSKITIWYGRGIYATDQYDSTVPYPLNATLFCGADGKLTTKQLSDSTPGIGIITGSPSASISTLEFMWL